MKPLSYGGRPGRIMFGLEKMTEGGQTCRDFMTLKLNVMTIERLLEWLRKKVL